MAKQSGMGFSADDVPYWGGFVVGVVAVGGTLRLLEYQGLILALASMAGGVAVGTAVEYAWKRSKRRPPDDVNSR